MQHTLQALAVIGALVIAVPASAQIVNGLNGANGSPEAPIGTKAGGSTSTDNAPGEAAAVAGAKQNMIEEKTMQPAPAARVMRRRHRVSAVTAGNMAE